MSQHNTHDRARDARLVWHPGQRARPTGKRDAAAKTPPWRPKSEPDTHVWGLGYEFTSRMLAALALAASAAAVAGQRSTSENGGRGGLKLLAVKSLRGGSSCWL